MKVNLRPFLECRLNAWGLSFSFGFERVYSIDHDAKTWLPNIWLQLGPFVAGVGIIF